MSQPTPSNRVTFPLALLFVILTGAAVIAALIGPVLRDVDYAELLRDPLPAIALLMGATIGGVALGAMLGLFQFNRLLGVIVGASVGGLIGPVAILLTTVPTSKINSVVPAVCIGSAILLFIAWLVRPPAPPEDEIVNAELAPEERSPGP